MREYLILRNGTKVPRLGQGTWMLGEQRHRRQDELEAMKTGIKAGMTLIDTAEMYGNGKSEELIGEVIKPLNREELFLVSKVYPHNAERPKIFESCKKSLSRLGTDHLDLYLLHWRGSIPLAETVACMEELVKEGLILSWGVSNFDTDDMEELWSVSDGRNCAVNQVLYHLASRGIEYDLLPWLREHQIPVMAYSPAAHGGDLKRNLYTDQVLLQIAENHRVSPVVVLLAFVLNQPDLIAIPRTGNPEHAAENGKAWEIKLTAEELTLLDRQYPAPNRKVPLDIL